MRGVKAPVSYDGAVDETPQRFVLSGFDFTVTLVDPWTDHKDQNIAAHGGLVIALGGDEFLVAGKGLTLTFAATAPNAVAAIEVAEEGRYVDGTWRPRRRLNGDQTHQGRHIRLPPDSFSVQRFRLYTYQ